MARMALGAGVGGLWLGLVLVLVGQVGIADIAGGGYVAGALAGGLVAYGIGRLVKDEG